MRRPYFLSLLFVTTTSAAEAAEVRVDAFSSNGGCGQNPSYDVIETSALDPTTNSKSESLRVFFNSFFLATSYPGAATQNCVLDATVRIPAGFRFRPVSAAVEGSYNLQSDTQGFIRVSYEVQPNGWSAEATNPKPFQGHGEISCIARLDEQLILGCSDLDTTINLHTTIDLSITHKGNALSQIEIDASRQNHDLSWNWELHSCSLPFEDRDFQTQYIAYNGQSIAAKLRLSGSRGAFQTTSGSGSFSQVTYSNRGRTAQGKWSSGGSGGTFIFTLVNEATGEFQGSWRDEKNPNQGGMWKGRYIF